jgi:transposase
VLNSEDLLAYPRALPAVAVPQVVVLDNAGLHVCEAVEAERRELAGRGISPYDLPPYSPELNRIGPVFRQVKYQELPVPCYTSKPAPRAAVDRGFRSYAGELVQNKCGK